MSGILKLSGNIYEVEACEETRLYIMESDEKEGTITIAMDISFKKGEYEGEKVKPSICINWHETDVSNFCDLVGRTFAVGNVEEADEREDTFYLFEHEPMESYQVTILEIKDNEVHIVISGIAITDGYSNPYKVADFNIDCWLSIPK